jgi:hypothetical protein
VLCHNRAYHAVDLDKAGSTSDFVISWCSHAVLPPVGALYLTATRLADVDICRRPIRRRALSHWCATLVADTLVWCAARASQISDKLKYLRGTICAPPIKSWEHTYEKYLRDNVCELKPMCAPSILRILCLRHGSQTRFPN